MKAAIDACTKISSALAKILIDYRVVGYGPNIVNAPIEKDYKESKTKRDQMSQGAQ